MSVNAVSAVTAKLVNQLPSTPETRKRLEQLFSWEKPQPQLDDTIEIHIPTFNEEDYIVETLESLQRQRLVASGKADLVLVDSHSPDKTVEHAEPIVDRVELVEKGKLTARQEAAERSDADILVYADAGDLYPEHWLDRLLLPFTQTEDCIATHGPRFYRDPLWRYTLAPYDYLIRPFLQISGANSALKREAFLNMGGFNTGVEMERQELRYEEEFRFHRRLKKHGTVTFVPTAYHYASARGMPFGLTLEHDRKYLKERRNGLRF